MGCGNKIKETCGDTMYATCVDFEGTLGVNTKITDSCVTIEETTEDLYVITDEVIAGLDTTELGQLCMTYPLEGGVVKPKAVFKALEAKVCELDTALQNLNNLKEIDITSWNLIDLGCLSDACSNPIITLGEWVQAVTTQICNP